MHKGTPTELPAGGTRPRKKLSDLCQVYMPKRWLTLEDFEKLSKGDIVHLWYWSFNQGDMWWKHDRVEDDRVYGQFDDDREQGDTPINGPQDIKVWSEVGGYLYEFGGHVCRGSGAEPVAGAKPDERYTGV